MRVRASRRRPQERRQTAFTLLEVFTVVVIIAILAALLLPVFSSLRSRAQRVQCTANLRSLYLAANVYVQQNGSWPQITISDSDTAEQDYANAWIAALARQHRLPIVSRDAHFDSVKNVERRAWR